MQKSHLTNFISRYHLAGLVESVIISIEDGKIASSFMDGGRQVIGNVSQNIDLPDGVLPISKTSGLLKILGALDNEIQMTYNIENKKVTSMQFSDVSKMKANYVLSDESVIEAVPNLKSRPKSSITIPLTSTFANSFKKALGALSESENFAIESKDGENVNIIVNYSTLNTNNIMLQATANGSGEILEKVCFPAKILNAILTANSDAVGTMEINPKLAIVSYTTPEYSSQYYLMKLTNVQ